MKILDSTFIQNLKYIPFCFSFIEKRERKFVIAKLVLDSLLSSTTIISIYLVGLFINRFLYSNPKSLSDFAPEILMYTVYYFTVRAFVFLSSYLETIIDQEWGDRMSVLIPDHLRKLPIEKFEDSNFANNMMLARENIDFIFMTIRRSLKFIQNAVLFIIFLISITLINPLFLVIIVLLRYVDARFKGFAYKEGWKFNKDTTEDRRATDAIITYFADAKRVDEIVITNAGDFLLQKVKNYRNEWKSLYTRIDYKLNFLNLGIESLAFSWKAGILLYNIPRVLEGALKVGDFQFQYSLLNDFSTRIELISEFINWYQNSYFKIKEIYSLYQVKPVDDSNLMEYKYDGAPEIIIKNLTFAYPNTPEKNVLEGINLEIKPGEKIAIVGANGAGKSTLTKIISKYYEIQSGSIIINGKNLNGISRNSWYKNLGIVMQDYNRYEFLTLAENILIGDPERQDTEFMKFCATQAECDNFISGMTNGFDTKMASSFKCGANLSTGQWQRLAIARFFYRNPNLVIFDEPTSAIDAIAEERIFGNIYNFFEGKTVIIISHRFSTVKKADKIYVLDKGSIVEEGSHSELLAMDGLYAKSYHLQTKE